MPYQMYSDTKIVREKHIWRKLKGGGYKCVLCGGIVTAKSPDNDSECERYEKLDETDRRLCPVLRK